MSTVSALLSPAFSQRLLLTLAHSLWLGAAIALLLALLLRLLPARRDNLRYAASLAALAALLAGCFAIWSILALPVLHPEKQPPMPATAMAAGKDNVRAETTQIGSPLPASTKNVQAQPSPAPSVSDPQPLAPAPSTSLPLLPPSSPASSSDWTSFLLSAWMLGVLLMLLRTFLLYTQVGRLTRQSNPVTNSAILSSLDALRLRFALRRPVHLAESAHLAAPAIVGFLRATILLPASAATGFSPEILQAIFAHELAHLRRHDYLVNFLQMLVESLLFFNPAVWWISRQVRIEREACCDHLAIAVSGLPREDYARALLDVVHALSRPAAPPHLSPTLAMSPTGHGLRDRLQRLLQPAASPRLRLPWIGLAAFLLTGLLLIAILGQSTFLAVHFAAKILTPKERQAKLEEIKRDYGYGAEPQSAYETSRQGKPATIEGFLVDANGAPTSATLRISILSQSKRNSAIAAGDTTAPNGHFHLRHVPPGQITLFLDGTDKYAASQSETFHVKPGETIHGIRLTAAKGISGILKVQNPAGRPIPGARFFCTLWFGGSGLGITPPPPTGTDGLSVFPYRPGQLLDLRMTAPGFQPWQKKDLVLPAGKPYVITLSPARPATGILLDQTTSRPIANAALYLLQGQHYSHPKETDLMSLYTTFTRTNAQGQFILNELEEGVEYIFLAKAPGHRPTLIRKVRAGQEDLRVTMKSPLEFHGKILWPKDVVGVEKRKINYTMFYTEYDSYTHSYSLRDMERREEGNATVFHITDLLEGKTELEAGGRQYQYDLKDSLANLIIDLAALEQKSIERQVLVRFAIPSDLPHPTGMLSCWMRPQSPTLPARWIEPSLDAHGEARMSIPAPCHLSLESKLTVGYWFPRMEIEIDTKTTPLVIPITGALPAGSIYGRMLDSAGTPCKNNSWSLRIVTPPKGVELSMLNLSLNNSGSTDPDGRFNISPLPLGGTYRIQAAKDYCIIQSRTITLDKKNPLVPLELRFPQGVDVTGRVELPDGRPAAGLSIQLSADIPDNSWGFASVSTDAKGEFIFHNLNPAFADYYYLSIPSQKDFRAIRRKIALRKHLPVIRLEKGRILTGTVVEHTTGKPISGAKVSVYSENHDRFHADEPWSLSAEAPTDPNGKFRFSNLGTGKYRLQVEVATNTGSISIPAPQPVTAGSPQPVTLRMKIPEGTQLRSVEP